MLSGPISLTLHERADRRDACGITPILTTHRVQGLDQIGEFNTNATWGGSRSEPAQRHQAPKADQTDTTDWSGRPLPDKAKAHGRLAYRFRFVPGSLTRK